MRTVDIWTNTNTSQLTTIDMTVSDGCGKTLRHRQVQHFGFEFEYGANLVDPNRPLEHRPIPPVCLTVLQRLVESGHVDRLSDQLTVNRYLPGQGIPPHIDSHSSCEEQLVSLSLSAQVVMDFRHATTGQQRSMVVPRRSVLIMSGDSRYIWTHGIAPRKSDVVPVTDHNGHQCLTLQRRDIRTSFTFRTLRQTPCRCNGTRTYRTCNNCPGVELTPTHIFTCPAMAAALQKIDMDPEQQLYTPKIVDIAASVIEIAVSIAVVINEGAEDRALSVVEGTAPRLMLAVEVTKNGYIGVKTPLLTADIKEGDAEVLEKTYVHKVYEDIASHFSETRHSPWPQVAQFLQSLPTGSVVLDAGCGNGKYLAAYGTSHLVMTGCDTSIGLLHICRSKGQDVVVADTTALPHRSDSVDACISIAVLHHLATQEVENGEGCVACGIVMVELDRLFNVSPHSCDPAFQSPEHLQKRRLQALQELARVLRPGGLALVYVWALEQDGPDGPSKYLKPQSIADPSQPASNTILPIHTNRTRFQSQDLFVPWKSKDGLTVHHRFYHVFTQGELESLVEQLPSDFKIVRNFYDSGNWCVVVEKLPSTQ
ncbi:ALKBH8 [Cordylochernes scorpioides]|uniref:ALKBH8 n=1 Tax=Cordylochernes scorpioides TaxID=51811 RepID=A0ABY6L8T8_9ARAC|nr:ALKBH8 [Cordylochernes scorpioides]